MKMKVLACAAAVAALCTTNLFATSPLGSGFTYQGRLNDGGAPANGTYDFGFLLHDDPVGSLYFGDVIVLSAVPVTNGLFTVQLNANGEFGPLAFNGQARWLEINVRTNGANSFVSLSPRQPLTPTPHALLALNVADGAVTTSKLAPGAIAWSNIVGIPAGFADGVDNGTNYAAGAGLTLSGANNQFSVNFAGTGVAPTAAHSDHDHFGTVWGGNTAFVRGLSVTNGAANSAALYGQQGTGSGFPYPFGNTAGVWGESSQGYGVYGASGYGTGSGVFGLGVAASGANRGVNGTTLSTAGTGVYGYAASTSGTNFGVYGQTDSTNGIGVLAKGSGTGGTALCVNNGAIRIAGAGLNTPTPAFIHEATIANTDMYSEYTIIDNPYCNFDPNAILLITGCLSKTAGSLTAPAQVFYDDVGSISYRHWIIISSNPVASPIVTGMRWNVLVIKP